MARSSMLKLWSVYRAHPFPIDPYYSTSRTRSLLFSTLTVDDVRGTIQPLSRCMKIIPHEFRALTTGHLALLKAGTGQ
jgi:hypothetical protein